VLEYPLGPYTALTALASVLWCTAFGVAGYALGANWDEVHRAFKYADYVVLALVVAGVAVLVSRALGRRARAVPSPPGPRR
jgi:membrane protein DedA with SNARE-associated domain